MQLRLKTKMKAAFLTSMVAAFLYGAPSMANQDGTSVGILAGWANLNNGGGSPFTYGVDLGWRKGTFIAPGFTYNTFTPNSVNVGGTSYSQGVGNLYAHGEFMLGDLGLGALAGASWSNNTTPGANNSTAFIWGLLAHWDWNLGDKITIGPRVNFIWNNQSGSYNETDLIGVLKYWF